MGMRSYSAERRIEIFWSKVAIGDPWECWPWMGSRLPSGYGHNVSIGFREKGYAHTFAFELYYEVIADQVCHRCDNPPCCNPYHLFNGTQSDNIRDALRKGRKGKLSYGIAEEIRSSYLIGDTSYGQLAKQYDVTRRTIADVIVGKTWGEIWAG